MENATNALLMAGGVLIGVLILTLAVYLYMSFGAEARENYELMERQQIVRFNAQFTKYVGIKDLTVYDVASVIAAARKNNSYYLDESITDSYKVTVKINGVPTKDIGNIEKFIEQNNNIIVNEDLVDEDIEFEHTYSCDSVDYYDNGRVKTVFFTKNF